MAVFDCFYYWSQKQQSLFCTIQLNVVLLFPRMPTCFNVDPADLKNRMHDVRREKKKLCFDKRSHKTSKRRATAFKREGVNSLISIQAENNEVWLNILTSITHTHTRTHTHTHAHMHTPGWFVFFDDPRGGFQSVFAGKLSPSRKALQIMLRTRLRESSPPPPLLLLSPPPPPPHHDEVCD